MEGARTGIPKLKKEQVAQRCIYDRKIYFLNKPLFTETKQYELKRWNANDKTIDWKLMHCMVKTVRYETGFN